MAKFCKELEAEFITKCQETCLRPHTLINMLYLEMILRLLYFFFGSELKHIILVITVALQFIKKVLIFVV